ncbi:cyclic nucleotide-binding/CBS domain-containing protein [Thiohalocapsa marina]|uniref:Cyclic nucleotide-binding/CBS domain-containing protein n=1 Tax=Thiohalocapsa marina TaxID=424902 RepID=A0A5M8FM54_9GAMM|nr:putative nucleotidyltransferase substrate binding domain-containing protein [Thiohalocapsa marina]KAA6185993.1 cyclic nucleotide-binding/CBS domain-containing protein [Thiohalocapsa marina]
MDVELIEIRDFLASHAPFEFLPEETLDVLPKKLAVRYLRRGTAFPPRDDEQPSLYLLRRGAVDLRDAEGNLVGKLAEGDICPSVCHPDDPRMQMAGQTSEDTLAYLLPCAELQRLRERHPEFAEHFDDSVSKRLRKALESIKQDSEGTTALMTVQVRDLLARDLVSAAPDTSIQEAAGIMSRAGCSSLVILDGERLAGIVTDRDLRNRCLAAGVSPTEPVSRIMTEKLETIGAGTLGFQALITMTRLNVHHLPVLDGGNVMGMLSTSDLVRVQSANSIYLVGDVRRAENTETLAAISGKVSELQVQLVASGATADQIGQAVSAVTDAITLRLLQLAEAELGPPPVPYCWMAGGSQARREQSSHSDQDNALLIADHMKPEDDAYFAALARKVNDGLHACGYIYCPGDVMASNPKWRQPLRIWTKYFNTWTKKPEPMALMLSSVFFDLRAIHDPEGLFDELQERVLKLSKADRIFIAYMAANALKHRPPLGFFRKFVLIHGGDHDQTFDIKHRGVVPIVDLARVYALSAGLSQTNTLERLKAAAAEGALSKDGGANLVDAAEFIGTLRMRHQAQQLKRGQKADNFLSPDDLSPLERGHLKDAFSLINTMQESLGQRYQAGRFT